jgi:hypothetical protein
VFVNSQYADPSTPGAFEPDSTIGDIDDMLMFTVRSGGKPFVGRVLQKRAPLPGETADPTSPDGVGPFVFVRTVESDIAEVAWFIRGQTLYRRVLLILPDFDLDLRTPAKEALTAAGFYADFDLSVHLDAAGNLVPNTLSDLTKPENRFAHRTRDMDSGGARSPSGVAYVDDFPFHPHRYVDEQLTPDILRPTAWSLLGLPTLRECSYVDPGGTWTWAAGAAIPAMPLTNNTLDVLDTANARGPLDLWIYPHVWPEIEQFTGTVVLDATTGQYTPPPALPAPTDPFQGERSGEDIILTNVVGFDVKLWDAGAPVLTRDYGAAANPRYVTLMPGDRAYLSVLSTSGPPGATPDERTSYGAYVDLNYMCRLGPSASDATKPLYWDTIQPTGEREPLFYGAGDRRSGLRGHPPDATANEQYGLLSGGTSWPLDSVYDSWSTHYESNGVNEDGDDFTDEGINGVDDPQDVNGNHVTGGAANGVVDDPTESETSPPYPVALQGIQIKLRVYEPDSRQVREVTVVKDFLSR